MSKEDNLIQAGKLKPSSDFQREWFNAVEATHGEGKAKDFEVMPDWFHDGQKKIWDRQERTILALAGSQSGKTVTGPHWLIREIQRRGPGEYLVAGPTITLLERKVIPEMERYFVKTLHVGFSRNNPYKIVFTESGFRKLWGSSYAVKFKEQFNVDSEAGVTVFFGYAAKYESLESMTLKAAWLDEAGQEDFTEESWEAIQRRLAVHTGRCLITTTPYTASGSWIEKKLYIPTKNGLRERRDGDSSSYVSSIGLVSMKSTDNPMFPQEEYDRLDKEWPKWKSDMMLRGLFTKPLGAVYDCFDEKYHISPQFDIPADWPRYLGVDFGGANTAAVCIAEDPKETEWLSPSGETIKGHRLYVYATYKEGSRSTQGHAIEITERGKRYNGTIKRTFGGSKGERQSRTDFTVAGLAIAEPSVTGPDSVAVGIQRVYRLLKRGDLLFFKGVTGKLTDELQTYSFKTDPDTHEATGEIKDKGKFHRVDALRYVCSSVRHGDSDGSVKIAKRYNSSHSRLRERV